MTEEKTTVSVLVLGLRGSGKSFIIHKISELLQELEIASEYKNDETAEGVAYWSQMEKKQIPTISKVLIEEITCTKPPKSRDGDKND